MSDYNDEVVVYNILSTSVHLLDSFSFRLLLSANQSTGNNELIEDAERELKISFESAKEYVDNALIAFRKLGLLA
ncbi:HPr-rel-A system PqqD family peptide chaperone [Methylomonas methanica]|uniref:HPr-rel-A system PqqD family peptide chaperone n=1 Tax=Methylomonas methanica TaxID=421 RepID=UPI001305245C|nr:HPr-rel-A system PqqD family peptide chaperone [Methylomonas methanica]